MASSKKETEKLQQFKKEDSSTLKAKAGQKKRYGTTKAARRDTASKNKGFVVIDSENKKEEVAISAINFFLKTGEIPLVRLTVAQIEPVIEFYEFSQADTAELMDLAPSTISRWKPDKQLGMYQSWTINELDKLIPIGIQIYGTKERFKEWLYTTNYALGSKKPVDIIKEMGPYGIEMVEDALEGMTWGNVL